MCRGGEGDVGGGGGGGGVVKFTQTNCKCLLHAVHSTVLVVIDVRREEDCLLAATGERASRSCPHLVPHYFQRTPCILSVCGRNYFPTYH